MQPIANRNSDLSRAVAPWLVTREIIFSAADSPAYCARVGRFLVERFDPFLPCNLFVTVVGQRFPSVRHLQQLMALRRARSAGHLPALGRVLAIFGGFFHGAALAPSDYGFFCGFARLAGASASAMHFEMNDLRLAPASF
jgi:hypothetical protein